MSADNWRECPHCKAATFAEKAKRVNEAAASYGTVPPEEYLAKMKAAETSVEIKETFREDYEIGTDDEFNFNVNYSGCCDICGLTVKFEHEEKVPDIVPTIAVKNTRRRR